MTPSPPGPSQAVHVVALVLVVVVKADDPTTPTPDVQARDICPSPEAHPGVQRRGARRMRRAMRRLTNTALIDAVRGIAYTTGATFGSMALCWLIHH